MKNYLILLSAILLIAYSCADEVNDPSDTVTELWPLEVGNEWTYHVFIEKSSDKGNLIATDTMFLKVWNKVIMDGEDWYLMSPRADDSEYRWKNSEQGFWRAEEDNGVIHKSLMFKYPTKVGDKSLLYDGENDYEEIVTKSIGINIDVFAKTYKCIKYQFNSHQYEDVYIAPGLGLVYQKSTTYIALSQTPPDTAWVIMKLAEYQLK